MSNAERQRLRRQRRKSGRRVFRIETEDRARAYVVLEAGREQALMADPDQVDIEGWLAGAER